MALDNELAYFKKQLPSLASSEGRFAVVYGNTMLGVFDTYDDAIGAAYEKLGIDTAFLVKQIHAIEQIQYLSRHIPIN